MLTRITGAAARRGTLGLIGPAWRLSAGRGRRAVARAGLAVAVSAVLTLAGSAGPALATASRHAHLVTGTGPGSGWSVAPTPNLPARTGQLIGVSCASSSSCTAVGDFTRGSGVVVTLAEHRGVRSLAQSPAAVALVPGKTPPRPDQPGVAVAAARVPTPVKLAGPAGPVAVEPERRKADHVVRWTRRRSQEQLAYAGVEVGTGLVMRTGGCSQAEKQGPGQPRI